MHKTIEYRHSNKRILLLRNIILFSFIFVSTLSSSMMSLPMGMMSKGAQMGLSMPIARDMVDTGTIFATNVLTKKNTALENKLYMYYSIMQEDKKNSSLSKILVERSFQFDKDSFIRIGGSASNNGEDNEYHIHSLYYDVDFFVNLLNIKIGRDVKTFGYGSHFNVIDFLSKNDTIYNENDKFAKRNSIDLISIRLNNTSKNNYISIYAYENDIADNIEKSNYLVELATTSKSSKSSIFFHTSDDNLSVSLATRKHLSDSLYIKSSIRYDKNSKKIKSLSSSSSISWHIMDSLLIGADYGAWKKDIKADNKSIIFHHISYAKLRLGDLGSKVGYLNDGTEKINLSLWYNIGDVKIYIDGFMDSRDNDNYLARFMISYLD